MLKKILLTLVFFFIHLSLFGESQSNEEMRREILVFIKKGYIDFPEGLANALIVENVNINSVRLSKEFYKFSVQSVRHAFPGFTDADTVEWFNGRSIQILHFSRIFVSQYCCSSLSSQGFAQKIGI